MRKTALRLDTVFGLATEAGNERCVEATEANLGQLSVGAIGPEAFGLPQVHHRRRDRRRELLRFRAKVAHVRVVEAAACGDVILGVGRLLLGIEKVRVGA